MVHGAGGADEATLEARNAVATVNGGQRRSVLIDFSQAWGMPRVRTSELAGGTAAENAARIVEVLEGRPGPVAEVVILNAAVAIQTARGCAPAEAVAAARASVTGGGALAALRRAAGRKP